MVAVTSGGGDGDGGDSDSSMPPLRAISDSSESEEETYHDEDEDYDDNAEDFLNKSEREAMDAASSVPDFYNPNAPTPELDELAGERKGNPFIKLLSALRGEKGHPYLRLMN